MKARMPGKAMLTAKQRTLPKALQEKIIKAKINKLTSSIKNLSVGKGVMKGIKFAGRVAVNPITLAIGAGAGIYKIGKTKSFDFPEERQFNRKGRKV